MVRCWNGTNLLLLYGHFVQWRKCVLILHCLMLLKRCWNDAFQCAAVLLFQCGFSTELLHGSLNCTLCNEHGHNVHQCKSFSSKTPRERNTFIMQKGADMSSKFDVRKAYVKYAEENTHPAFMEIMRHYIPRHRQAVRRTRHPVEVPWEKTRKPQISPLLYIRYLGQRRMHAIAPWLYWCMCPRRTIPVRSLWCMLYWTLKVTQHSSPKRPYLGHKSSIVLIVTAPLPLL